MLELYLFRHGQTDSNIEVRFLGATDIPLNETGISQARAAVFNNVKFDALYASPLTRTVQTAEILNENQGLEIITLDGLRERNFGCFDNMTVEEMKKLDMEEYSAWQADTENYRISGGESPPDVFKRISRVMDEIIDNHRAAVCGEKNEKVLIVSHLNAIRFMLSAVLVFSFCQSRMFDIGNAAYIRLEITDSRRVIIFGKGD